MYIAECPSIPGCVSEGRTEAEAESNIADAIRECLAVRIQRGMAPTIATREVEVTVCERTV
jgi:predicted RNase H-like HicB family nuclease